MATCTWRETNSTLHKLERLLQCPLCKHMMDDPCTLGNCDHHFCRTCILGALSGRDSRCPECGLPAWMKDLKSNRQLTNLVHLTLHMRELTTGGGHQPCVEEALFSSKGVPTPSSSAIASNTSCTSSSRYDDGTLNFVSDLPGPSRACSSFQDQQVSVQHCATLADTTAPPRRPQADKDEAVFCKPHIGKQLLRRRLKVCLKPNFPRGMDDKPALLRPEAENFNSCSKWKAGGQPHRLPLDIVNHRRAKSLPGHDILPPKRMHYVDADVGPASSKEQATHAKSFGEMGRKRSDSTDKEYAPNVSRFSLQFPFSPLVTKTRNYAKLDGGARVQRLQQAGYLAQKRLRSNSGGMVPKLRRVHQLKMEAFVKANTVAGGCTTAAGRSGRSADDALTQTATATASVQHGGSSGSLESPVPATPSSAHARTMRRNIRGETPLHIAAIKGDVSAVRALLQEGADPNAKDHAGWTPLHEACNHGYVEVASLLLDHGALVNVPGFENDTPLHDAVTNGHVKIASLLVSRGANTIIRNSNGHTAHELAVTNAMREALTQVIPLPNFLVSPNSTKSPHSSPVLSGMPGRTVLLATGLKGYQKTQIEELADLLGAQVVNSFSPEVSHVITVCDKHGCCPRTLKFLCAVALGKWIVSFQWISKCLQERNWVNETLYEVQGVTVGDSTLITEAPRKGRENASQKAPGLFDGCQFYFSGVFSPPRASKEDLSHLVKLAGGRVLAREPRSQEDSAHICPYHAAPQSLFFCNHTFIVYDSHSEHSPAKVRASNVITVPSSWLLDCLSHFELLDVTE